VEPDAWVLLEPALDLRCAVRGRIVEHDVQLSAAD
jgi:hypothetical protein